MSEFNSKEEAEKFFLLFLKDLFLEAFNPDEEKKDIIETLTSLLQKAYQAGYDQCSEHEGN